MKLSDVTGAPQPDASVEPKRRKLSDITGGTESGGDSQAFKDARGVVKQEDPGMRSFLGGATFGYLDDLSATEHAAITGAENLYRRATGKPVPYGIGESFHAYRQAETESEQEFEKKHPVVEEALSFGGGLMAPGAKQASEFVSAGKNILSKGGRAALTGAGFGALAGGSDEGDRLGGVERGAGEGTLLGGSLHLFGTAVNFGLPQLAKRMGSGAVEAWNRITQMFGADDPKITPEQRAQARKRALQYVHDVAQKAGKDPAAIAQNPDFQKGTPVIGAEAIGRPGVQQLTAIGRRAGTTPDLLETQLRQRQLGQGERLVGELEQVTGVDASAIEGNFDKQVAALRAKAKPFYDVAYEKQADTPELRQLLVRPSVKQALSRARGIAEEEGRNAEDIGLVKVGKLAQVGQNLVDTSEDIEVRNPTMRTWDYIKRGLDDVLETYRDKTTGKLVLDEKGHAVLNTLNELRQGLFKASPEYEMAVSLGGEAPRQQEAYRAVPKLLSNNLSTTAFDKRIAGYTPAQREALKGGFISDVYNRVQGNRMRLKDTQTPTFIHKAQKILGNEAADKFLAKVQAEMRIAGTGQRMIPGAQSATAEIVAADREGMEALTAVGRTARAAGKGDWIGAVLHAVGGPFAGFYRGAQTPIDQATRDEVGRLLMLDPDKLGYELAQHRLSAKNQKARSIVRKFADNPAVLDLARRVAVSFGEHTARSH